MRIPSGSTDRYIYFVAVDATDRSTREIGLTSFTVYRSRNGGAAAAMTTPTVNEVSAANMPGVYELLIDEDTTIGASNDNEAMVLHITHTGMVAVTREIELYRPKTAEGTLAAAATDLAAVDTNVDAILIDTGTMLPASLAAIETDTQNIQSRIPPSLSNGAIDANITRVNNVAVTGDGNTGTEWGP